MLLKIPWLGVWSLPICTRELYLLKGCAGSGEKFRLHEKILSQLAFGLKLFEEWRRVLKTDRTRNPEQVRLLMFCEAVLDLYKKHGVDETK